MNEIKAIGHLTRNIYLFVLLIISLNLINGFTIKPETFLLGLIAYFVSYSPVYLANDYADHEEDVKYKKANLFVRMQSKYLFLFITTVLVLTGITLTFTISKTAMIFLIILYFLNVLYSFEPMRFRNRFFFRELTIFLVYFFKWLLISALIGFPYTELPFLMVIMSCALAAMSVAIYKRSIYEGTAAERFFGFIFLISWLATLFFYGQTLFIFLPLLPVATLVFIKYKSGKVPLDIFQLLYFAYAVIVYFAIKKIWFISG